MADIKRQKAEAARVAQSATAVALTDIIKKSGKNLKLAHTAASNGKHHIMAVHLADAIVYGIEAGDLVDKNIMAMVFDRLKKLDRMNDD